MALICYCLTEEALADWSLLRQRAGFYQPIIFILFSTTQLSQVVLSEIQIASSKFHDKSKIIVIYDNSVGNNLKRTENFTDIYINRSSSVEEILNSIINKIKSIQHRGSNQSDFLSVLGPILLTGIGLFALASIFDNPAPSRKITKKKRVPAKKAKRAIAKTRS